MSESHLKNLIENIYGKVLFFIARVITQFADDNDEKYDGKRRDTSTQNSSTKLIGLMYVIPT